MLRRTTESSWRNYWPKLSLIKRSRNKWTIRHSGPAEACASEISHACHNRTVKAQISVDGSAFGVWSVQDTPTNRGRTSTILRPSETRWTGSWAKTWSSSRQSTHRATSQPGLEVRKEATRRMNLSGSTIADSLHVAHLSERASWSPLWHSEDREHSLTLQRNSNSQRRGKGRGNTRYSKVRGEDREALHSTHSGKSTCSAFQRSKGCPRGAERQHQHTCAHCFGPHAFERCTKCTKMRHKTYEPTGALNTSKTTLMEHQPKASLRRRLALHRPQFCLVRLPKKVLSLWVLWTNPQDPGSWNGVFVRNQLCALRVLWTFPQGPQFWNGARVHQFCA